MNDINALVWAEAHRPRNISECILPDSLKKMVTDSIKNSDIPHFIFAGQAGTGKTSLARAIANELDADLLYINASRETSIDVIRTSVVSFASTVSLSGSKKIILLDEMEGMSQNASNSLKGVYEEFPNVRFICTTNHLGKVIDALKSRSVVIEFKIDSKEKPRLAAQMFKRCMAILAEHKVEFDQKVVAELVNKYFPDFRRTLNELQRYSSGGSITSGILLGDNKETYKSLLKAIDDKDFKSMRKWVGENSDQDPAFLYKDFYENCLEYFETKSVPTLILLMADYQFKGTHAVDQQINLAAFLVEIMVNCKVKV